MFRISVFTSRISYSTLLITLLGAAAGVLAGAVVSFVHPAAAFAALLGLAGAAVLARDARWGLYAVLGVVTLLPFAAVPLNVGFSPTFLDLVTLLLVGVWLAQIATGRQAGWITTPLDLPILLFVGLAFFSFIIGLSFAGLTVNVLRHFAEIILAVALYFVVTNILRRRTDLERAVGVLILLGFVAALLGIVLYVIPDDLAIRLLSSLRVFKYPSGDGVLRFIEDNPDLPKRAISTSVDPNVLGGLLIVVTSLTIPQLFSTQRLFWRGLVALIVGTMGLCLMLTFSRGSLLGTAVAAAFLLFAWLSRRLAPLVAALATLGAGVVLALAGFGLLSVVPLTQPYAEHLVEGLMGLDQATLMRFGEYKDALNLIGRYPWFGIGFAGVPEIDLYIGVSSVYLLIAEEMGLVGLGAFVLVVVILLANAWLRYRASCLGDPILLGLMAAVVAALVGGIFDHYFFNLDFPHSVTLFWSMVAMTMAAARYPPTRAPAHDD